MKALTAAGYPKYNLDAFKRSLSIFHASVLNPDITITMLLVVVVFTLEKLKKDRWDENWSEIKVKSKQNLASQLFLQNPCSFKI